MTSQPLNGGPWSPLLGSGTPTVTMPWTPRARRAALARVAQLPTGSSVALTATGPLGRVQLRRAAARCGVALEHEYVVLPGLGSSRYVVEDDPDTIALLWGSLVAPPPRLTRGSAAVTALAALGRRHAPWWVLGSALPRVALGRRSARP